jgi:hypothetical protein
MIVYESLAALIAETDKLDKLGTLYVQREKWCTDPTQVEILLLIGDDELEDLNDEGTPLLAAQRNARYFLDVEIFQSVIELQREKNPASRVDDYVFALNYYLENDDFY